MKYYVFQQESNNFDEILNDPTIKGSFKTKIKWKNHLMLGFTENEKNNNLFGYIVLKFGDHITDPYAKDYTPVPGKDYIPDRSVKSTE